MSVYKKIDIYFNGDYVCSTNQAKTCKEAIKRYLESAHTAKHSLCGATFIQEYILRRPSGLKAYFDKDKK